MRNCQIIRMRYLTTLNARRYDGEAGLIEIQVTQEP
jgi:hypothetical protein